MSNSVSIVIPTRNRAKVVRTNVLAALNPRNPEVVEVVVADNGDPDQLVNDELRDIADPRLKIVRTGGLSMTENWEAGLAASSGGTYIHLIEDKQCLIPGRLGEAVGALASSGKALLVWRSCFLGQSGGGQYITSSQLSGELTKVSSCDALERFLQHGQRGVSELPLAHYTLFERRYYDLVMRKFGHCMFPNAPDYSFAFMCLLELAEFLVLDRNVSYFQSIVGSNGAQARLRSGDNFEHFRARYSVHPSARILPLSSLTITNLLYGDFINVARIHDPDFNPEHELDWVAYFALCHEDIRWGLANGGNGFEADLAEWQTEVGKLPASTRRSIEQQIAGGPMPGRMSATMREAAKRLKRTGVSVAGRLLRQLGPRYPVTFRVSKQSYTLFPGLLDDSIWQQVP